MPDFAIVDTHVHLWDPQRLRMRWIDGNAVLERRFDLADYREHTRGVEIEAMVYMEVAAEPAYMLHEAQWANAQALHEPRLRGIVARASLEDGEPVRTQLEALKSIGPRIKGVRRVLETEKDDRYCLRPGFLHGVRMLEEFGFPFHICIFHHQLPAAIELVRACPTIEFVLDHVAKPDIGGRRLDPWRAHMQELAALPNVACKISGMVTEAGDASWSTADLRPYVEHAIECFGQDRVIYGSDFPVLIQKSTYTRWVDCLDEITCGLSDAAKRKLWVGNAKRIYRL